MYFVNVRFDSMYTIRLRSSTYYEVSKRACTSPTLGRVPRKAAKKKKGGKKKGGNKSPGRRLPGQPAKK